MDNLTHTLFALTLARTPLGRGRGTTAALVLASSAPDIDFVASLAGSASYLEWHRGPTHGPIGVAGLGLVTAALVWGAARVIQRRADARTQTKTPASKGERAGSRDGADGSAGIAPFSTLLAVSTVGVLAHILMDLPTSYGTRVLSPFTWRWFALDFMPIIDIYLLLVLAGGLLLGRGSPRGRRIGAAAVLALMAANYGLRGFAHQEALSRTERLFGPTLPRACDATRPSGSLLASWPVTAATRTGTTPDAGIASDDPITTGSCRVETAAIPTFLSPFRWRVIARLTDAYEIYDIDVTDAELRSRTPSVNRLTQISVRIPNEWTPLIDSAARAPGARALMEFSRFPRAEVVGQPHERPIVRFSDMRFTTGREDASPTEARRSSLFTATVRIRGEQ